MTRWTLAAAVVLTSRLAMAQGGTIDVQCRGGTVQERATQDACQKALDIFAFMAPQLGTAIAGGNAISGEHSALRGVGRFSIGLRANAVRARLPEVEAITPVITGARVSDYAVEEQVIPVPTIDAAVGLFNGLPIGGTRALGLDALVNVAYLPEVSAGDVSVALPNGTFKFGFGARLSLVQESVISPGISVTWLQRDLPTLDLSATPGSDEIRVNDLQVKTRAWRAVIGKNFGVLSLSGGVGQDTYETSALANVRVARGGVTYAAGPVSAIQEFKRDNAFGSVALNLAMFSIVGEYGRASHGKLATYNTFGTARADDAIDYLSIGIRIRR